MIAASETLGEGYGAISEVSRATGVSRRAISQGVQELKQGMPEPQRKGRIRREGGGRKKAVDVDSTLRSDLEQLIEPATRGDPESPVTVDMQESPLLIRRTEGKRAYNQPSNCCRVVT